MKRIIACTDGTWNKPGATDNGVVVQTNVEKMFNAIPHCTPLEVEQIKAYDEGVGTSYTLRDKLLGGITGDGLDKHIMNMYFFLSLNYEPGDHIYLFGFSRGAYTARSLAGLIRCCGLLKPENIHLLNKAYELYRDRNSYTTPDSDLMKSFKLKYAFEEKTPIKFIGVWDTVGSLGIPLPQYKMYNADKYRFHDTKLSSTVENAYHALSIDERRKLFVPTLWERSNTVKNDPTHPQKMEQRWFIGSHSNVGGGYDNSGLSDIALKWLIDKAQETGLYFDEKVLNSIVPDAQAPIRDSYTLIYYMWNKIWRQINDGDPDTNQTIDETVFERYKDDKKYRPGNVKKILKSNEKK